MCLSIRLDFIPTTLPSKEVSNPTLLAEIRVEIWDREYVSHLYQKIPKEKYEGEEFKKDII